MAKRASAKKEKTPPGVVIGIDAGLKGALGVVALDGSFDSWHRMPVREDAHGKKTIDVHALFLALHGYAGRCVMVCTERLHAFPHDSKAKLWRFALGVGRMEATVELCLPGVPFMDADPQVIKAEVLGSRSASKAETVAWARARWPGADLPAADGVSDALCQAVFGLRWLDRSENGEGD